jgi:hypothetical protein
MSDEHLVVRIPRRWMRMGIVALVTAAITVPLTAIASHTFDDVPDSNIFHDDIAWLRAADVTRGCNPPANTLYCPKDNVTREQMAAFMRRLAQNRVVDAATVEGKGASELSVQGWTIVETSNVTLAAVGSTATATATCPGGTNVVGGGWTQVDGTFQIHYLRNRPNDAGTAWEVTAENAGPNTNRNFRAFAICAVVNP